MGTVCDGCNCNIFPNPDESSSDIEEKVPLVMNPALTHNSHNNHEHTPLFTDIDDTFAYNETDIIQPINDIEFEHNNNSNISITPPPESIAAPITNNIAQRRAIFEMQFEKDTKPKIKKKKRLANKNMYTNHKKETSIKTANKAKKKWIVKGIDDNDINKTQTLAIHASCSTTKDTLDIDDDEEREPSISLSHNDRMKMYECDLLNTQNKQKEREQQYKQSRDGYSGIKVSDEQKNRAKQLLQQRVEKMKKGDMQIDEGAADIVLFCDNTANGENIEQDTGKKKKKRTLNELLKAATKEDGKNIMNSMGLIHNEEDKQKKCDVNILNMNNSDMISKMAHDEKLKFVYLLAHSVIDGSSENIDRLTMCNAGIDDKLMMELMRILIGNKDKLILKELWLESNKIGDDGMNALCAFIVCNVDSLRVIKLYNNKKDVSTAMCNKMLAALDKNNRIIKFTFEWRLKQQIDRMEKILRRNQDLRRKEKKMLKK